MILQHISNREVIRLEFSSNPIARPAVYCVEIIYLLIEWLEVTLLRTAIFDWNPLVLQARNRALTNVVIESLNALLMNAQPIAAHDRAFYPYALKQPLQILNLFSGESVRAKHHVSAASINGARTVAQKPVQQEFPRYAEVSWHHLSPIPVPAISKIGEHRMRQGS